MARIAEDDFEEGREPSSPNERPQSVSGAKVENDQRDIALEIEDLRALADEQLRYCKRSFLFINQLSCVTNSCVE